MEPKSQAIPENLPDILRSLYECTLDAPQIAQKIPWPWDAQLAIAMRNAFDLGRTMIPDVSVAGVQTGWDKYEELRATLEGLPATWYPALLGSMVKASYIKGKTWVPGGAGRFVKNIEARLGMAAAAMPEGADPMTTIGINSGTGNREYPVHRDVRALIDGLSGSIQILRESVNRERAGRINPEIARKALSLLEVAERETNRIVQDGADFRLSVPARPGHDSDLVILSALEAGRKLAEAVLAQVAAARAPAKTEDAAADATETTALPRGSVAETAAQPMDATQMILLGMVGIENLIAGLASHHTEETGPVLERIREVAAEIRLALGGKV